MQSSTKSPGGKLPSASRGAWRYGDTAIALHWLLAVLLPATSILGWIMVQIEKEPGSARYFELHKSVGLVILLLVLTRVAWRLANVVEGLPATLAAWEVKLARVVQLMLYVLMVLVPVVGYLGASYSKAGVEFFGVSTLRWAFPNHDTAEQAFEIHSALVWVLVATVVVHTLGALKHLLLDKDGVFARMWFASRR